MKKVISQTLSINSILLLLIPEVLGIAGVVLFYQCRSSVLAIIALCSFLVLFFFVFMAGRCLILLMISLILISIPVSIFFVKTWYMGFLLPFVSAYGLILLALLASQLFNVQKPLKYRSRVFDFEENINN